MGRRRNSSPSWRDGPTSTRALLPRSPGRTSRQHAFRGCLTPASHLACQVMAPLKTSVSTVSSFYYVPPALFHHTLFSQFLQHDLPSHCLRAMLCMADSPVAANLVRNYSPHLRPEGNEGSETNGRAAQAAVRRSEGDACDVPTKVENTKTIRTGNRCEVFQCCGECCEAQTIFCYRFFFG